MQKGIISILIGACLLGVSCTEKRKKQDEQPTQTRAFNEPYRPQIHFSPPTCWMNDPNGMVYYEGEYHLFYQHNPEESVWGPMHWGHAISRDLVHWEHHPIALYPDSLGTIFSGSAVVDWKNTSGLGSDMQPPLIAFFTYHNMEIEKANGINVESQAIAYSLDKGRTWQKYTNNPVLANPGIRDFRDPKVFWNEASSHWIMSVASGQVIRFYQSKDCIHWDYLSDFGEGYGNHEGVWECPDLFPLKVQGTDEEKWVLVVNISPGGPSGGSATQYFVGQFDGIRFSTNQRDALWMDHGKDNYAGVTWSDSPDGRRILIGWMNNWQYAGKEPTKKWSGAATFPREMGLVKDQELYLLTSTPIQEWELLSKQHVSTREIMVKESFTLSDQIDFATAPLAIKLTFDQQKNTEITFPERYGIQLKNNLGEYISIGYDNVKKRFFVDRTNATGPTFSDKFAGYYAVPYILNKPETTWFLLIDRSSVELFAAEGRIVMTNTFFPSEPFDIVELFADKGHLKVTEATVTALKSIWE